MSATLDFGKPWEVRGVTASMSSPLRGGTWFSPGQVWFRNAAGRMEPVPYYSVPRTPGGEVGDD